MATATISVPRKLCRKTRITSAMSTQGLQHLALQPRVRRLDEGGLVEDRFDDHPRGQIPQSGDDLLHGVDDLERVAAGDSQDVQVDGVLTVDRDGLRRSGATVFDVRDVRDVDRATVDQLDHRVADLPDMLRDGVGVDVGIEGRRDELTRGEQRVGLSDGGGDVLGRDAARLCLGAVDDDVDLPLSPAVGRRACDARGCPPAAARCC